MINDAPIVIFRRDRRHRRLRHLLIGVIPRIGADNFAIFRKSISPHIGANRNLDARQCLASFERIAFNGIKRIGQFNRVQTFASIEGSVLDVRHRTRDDHFGNVGAPLKGDRTNLDNRQSANCRRDDDPPGRIVRNARHPLRASHSPPGPSRIQGLRAAHRRLQRISTRDRPIVCRCSCRPT